MKSIYELLYKDVLINLPLQLKQALGSYQVWKAKRNVTHSQEVLERIHMMNSSGVSTPFSKNLLSLSVPCKLAAIPVAAL